MKKMLIPLTILSALSLLACSVSMKPNSSSEQTTSSESESSSEEKSSVDQDIYNIYKLYLSNGGTMSYEEWLESIKGEKGDQGDLGPKGEDGIGIDAINKVGTSGYVDTYEIVFTDGSKKEFTVTNGIGNKTIVNTYLDESQHLIIVYSDGSSYDTGHIFEIEENEDLFDYYPLNDGTYGVGEGRATELDEIRIPSTHNGKPVTRIVENGFQNTRARNIYLPDSINYLSKYSFSFTRNIEHLYLSNNIELVEPAFMSGPIVQAKANGFVTTEYGEMDYIGSVDNPYLCAYTNIQSGTSPIEIHEDCKILYGVGIYQKMDNLLLPKGIKQARLIFYPNSNESTIYIPSTIKNLELQYNYGSENSFDVIYNGSLDEWNAIDKTINANINLTCQGGEEHVHAFSDKWTYDESNHWHKSTCIHNLIKDEAPHSLGEWVITQEATALQRGIRKRTCSVCGYEEIEYINQLSNLDYYDLPDGTYGVAVGKSKFLTEITIPETYNDIPVTKVVDEGFKNCTSLETITLPSSITNIGDNAFEGCSNLTTIDLSHVNNFGAASFIGCTSLNNIDLASATDIGQSAFFNCSSLEEVIIPNTIEVLKANTFEKCTSLETIYLPASLNAINYCFEYCSQIRNVYYGGTLSDWCNISTNSIIMNQNATFYYHDNDGTVEYNNEHFIALGSTLVVPDGVTTLYRNVFINFPIDEIVLPDGLTRIETGALMYTNITSISLPDSLEYVGTSVFPSSIQYNISGDAKYLGNNTNPYLVLVSVTGNHTTESTCKIVAESVNFQYASYLVKYTANVKYIYTTVNHGMDGTDATHYYIAYYLGTIDDVIYCSSIVPIYSEDQPTDTEHVYWHGDVTNRRHHENIWSVS